MRTKAFRGQGFELSFDVSSTPKSNRFVLKFSDLSEATIDAQGVAARLSPREVRWLGLQLAAPRDGSVVTLNGKDFRGNCETASLGVGSQGVVCCNDHFAFKTLPVTSLTESSLPLQSEVAFALTTAGSVERPRSERLVAIHAVWYESERLILAMDRHAMSMEFLQDRYLRKLLPTFVYQKPVFWDPHVVAGSQSPRSSGPPRSFPATTYAKEDYDKRPQSTHPENTSPMSAARERHLENSEDPEYYDSRHLANSEHGFVKHYGGTTDSAAMKKSYSEANLSHVSSMLELCEDDQQNESHEVLCGKRVTGLPEELLFVLAYDVLDALKSLHEVSFLMHNDVKPANILLSKAKNGFILCDFGCSLPVDKDGIADPTMSAQGTPHYRSPEAFVRFERNPLSPNSSSDGMLQSARSNSSSVFDVAAVFSTKLDVWSLGVTLLELKIGKVPPTVNLCSRQSHETPRDAVEEVDEKGFVRPTRSNFGKVDVADRDEIARSTASQSLKELLQRMMTIDPVTRPSAAELLRDRSFAKVAVYRENLKKFFEMMDKKLVEQEELPALEEELVKRPDGATPGPKASEPKPNLQWGKLRSPSPQAASV